MSWAWRFAGREGVSQRLKKSRSELYREAVAVYVARHEAEAVTEALNQGPSRTISRRSTGYGGKRGRRRTGRPVAWVTARPTWRRSESSARRARQLRRPGSPRRSSYGRPCTASVPNARAMTRTAGA